MLTLRKAQRFSLFLGNKNEQQWLALSKDPTSAELQLHREELPGYTKKGYVGKFESTEGINRSGATPQERTQFEQFLSGRMQGGQHTLSHSPPNSPGRVNPLESPRQDEEDVDMQVTPQENDLTIPQDLAEQIDAIKDEEVDPKSLLLGELHSRYVRGELNSTDDVRKTFTA
jgi:hypothetical protein